MPGSDIFSLYLCDNIKKKKKDWQLAPMVARIHACRSRRQMHVQKKRKKTHTKKWSHIKCEFYGTNVLGSFRSFSYITYIYNLQDDDCRTNREPKKSLDVHPHTQVILFGVMMFSRPEIKYLPRYMTCVCVRVNIQYIHVWVPPTYISSFCDLSRASNRFWTAVAHRALLYILFCSKYFRVF